MELLKAFVLVGASAGIGAFAGDKLFAAVAPKLPATVTSRPAAVSGLKIGMQAGGAVVAYGVLRAIF